MDDVIMNLVFRFLFFAMYSKYSCKLRKYWSSTCRNQCSMQKTKWAGVVCLSVPREEGRTPTEAPVGPTRKESCSKKCQRWCTSIPCPSCFHSCGWRVQDLTCLKHWYCWCSHVRGPSWPWHIFPSRHEGSSSHRRWHANYLVTPRTHPPVTGRI